MDHKTIIRRLEQSGYESIRLNGVVMKLTEIKNYNFHSDKHYTFEIVIGRLSDVKKQNVASLVDKAIDLSNGSILVVDENTGDEQTYSTYPYCAASNRRFDPIEPRTFSFNSPYGACPRCTGLGYTLDVDPELIIPNPRLTLAEGAIQPWTRIVGNQNYYQKLLIYYQKFQ
jgi:excinuclease ABC subunit A